MDADWSVELGKDDPALEFPWASPDGAQAYVDLRNNPDALADLPEARQYAPLAAALAELNRPSSPWLTAKCDAWSDDEIARAEALHKATFRMCAYVDLVRSNESERFSFEQHERWAKSAAKALDDVDESLARCELIVRRCYFHPNATTVEDSSPGFYITAYVFGYGDSEPEASKSWGYALARVSAVLLALAQ